MNNKEIRQITTEIELRANEDDKQEYIEGYALKFDRWSEPLGWGFKEIISPNALDETDFSDVVACFNHSMMHPLARNTVPSGEGSLQLDVDGIGLKFRFIPTNTTYANDLKANMRSGVVNKCSFAFYLDYSNPDSDKWEWVEDTGEEYDKRTINKIAKVSDISIVVQPAYKDTESVVSERCLEVKQERKEQLKSEEQRQLKIKEIEIELELI